MIAEILSWLEGAAPNRHRAVDGIAASIYRASPKGVIVLVDEAGAPCFLVKVAREASAEPSLVAEYEALHTLRASSGDWVRGCTPKPIALGRVGGRLCLAESYLEGVPMTSRYYAPGHTRSPARVARDFSTAAGWLSRFQQETANDARRLEDEAIERLVRDPIARYRAEIGWSDAEEELFDEALLRAESMRGAPLPTTGRHGDLWMANLLVRRDGEAGAIDWEHSSLNAFPVDDIYKFPTSYSGYLDRAAPGRGRVSGHPGWAEARERWRVYGDWPNLAGFGYVFFGTGWYPTLVRTWFEERSAALGIDPSMHAIFFPVFLARQATTLSDPAFRSGYRAAILGLSAERRHTWLWHDPSLPPRRSLSV
jgi:hypothetical protein